MARTAAARTLLALASTLLLLILGCVAGAATAGAATTASAATQGPRSAGGGSAGGDANRSGAEGELVKDDVVRTGSSPTRRRDGADPLCLRGRGRGPAVRGADEHGGDTGASRSRHCTAPSRGAPAAERIALLQVFRR